MADDEQWVTLRQAAAAAHVSISALRKWYRAGVVRAEDRPGPHGSQKMVALDDVYARVNAFRAAGTTEVSHSANEASHSANEASHSANGNHVALLDRPPAPTFAEPAVPPGSVVIAREDWERVLNMVGWFHSAADALGDAREAMARHATAEEFLRAELVALEERAANMEADYRARLAVAEVDRAQVRADAREAIAAMAAAAPGPLSPPRRRFLFWTWSP